MTFLDSLRGFGEMTLKGLVTTNAPQITRGMLNELLRRYKVDVDAVVPLITKNESLWSMIPPEHYNKVRRVIGQVGDIKWLNADWTIEAIKKEHPALASLFLGWRKGRNWLERQLEEIKTKVETL